MKVLFAPCRGPVIGSCGQDWSLALAAVSACSGARKNGFKNPSSAVDQSTRSKRNLCRSGPKKGGERPFPGRPKPSVTFRCREGHSAILRDRLVSVFTGKSKIKAVYLKGKAAKRTDARWSANRAVMFGQQPRPCPIRHSASAGKSPKGAIATGLRRRGR